MSGGSVIPKAAEGSAGGCDVTGPREGRGARQTIEGQLLPNRGREIGQPWEVCPAVKLVSNPWQDVDAWRLLQVPVHLRPAVGRLVLRVCRHLAPHRLLAPGGLGGPAVRAG